MGTVAWEISDEQKLLLDAFDIGELFQNLPDETYLENIDRNYIMNKTTISFSNKNFKESKSWDIPKIKAVSEDGHLYFDLGDAYVGHLGVYRSNESSSYKNPYAFIRDEDDDCPVDLKCKHGEYTQYCHRCHKRSS